MSKPRVCSRDVSPTELPFEGSEEKCLKGASCGRYSQQRSASLWAHWEAPGCQVFSNRRRREASCHLTQIFVFCAEVQTLVPQCHWWLQGVAGVYRLVLHMCRVFVEVRIKVFGIRVLLHGSRVSCISLSSPDGSVFVMRITTVYRGLKCKVFIVHTVKWGVGV